MIKFGTGGWRAIIADDFTKANIRLLTAGLCELMLKEGHAGAEICVAHFVFSHIKAPPRSQISDSPSPCRRRNSDSRTRRGYR